MSHLGTGQKAALAAAAVVAVAGVAYYVSRRRTVRGAAEDDARRDQSKQPKQTKAKAAGPKGAPSAGGAAPPARSLELANNAKNEGNRLFGKGRHAEAAALYTDAIALCPEGETECAKFYANRAACYARMGQFDRVIEDCSAAVAIDPQYAKAWQRRAQAYEETGRLDDALDDLGSYSALVGPEDPAAQASITRVLERIGADKAKAAVAGKRGRFPPASVIKIYLVSLRAFPKESDYAGATDGTDAPSLYRLGLSRLASGSHAEALTAFEKCAQADPAHSDALLHLGTLLHLVGDHDRALEVLERAAQVDAARTGARVRIANLLFLQGRTAEAMAAFEAVLRDDPQNAVARYHAAQAHQHQGQLDVAMGHYEAILKDAPGDYEALIQRGLVCFQIGLVFAQQPTGVDAAAALFHQAVESFQEAIKADPSRPEAHVQYASFLSAIGQADEAMAEYDKALAADARCAIALTSKGQLVFQTTGNAEAAAALHARAIEYDPDSIEARCNMAMHHLQTGDFERAVAEYDRAAELGFIEQDLATIFAFREAAVSRLKNAQRGK